MGTGSYTDETALQEPRFGHERLLVYRRALQYIGWTSTRLTAVEGSIAALDHWKRAAESIAENLANGNSRRSRSDRNRYFDIAIGSALECAACLDIRHARESITKGQQTDGKTLLRPIVSMTIKLRDARSDYVRDPSTTYGSRSMKPYFPHETLNTYITALELIVWMHGLPESFAGNKQDLAKLDKESTSLVLNIAEGNGRFSKPDQIRFLDIAHTCAMRTAAHLDILATKNLLASRTADAGKHILVKLCPLLIGLRTSLESAV